MPLRHLKPAAASYRVSVLCVRFCTASRSFSAGSGWAPAGKCPPRSLRCPTFQNEPTVTAVRDQRHSVEEDEDEEVREENCSPGGLRVQEGGCHTSAEQQQLHSTVITGDGAQLVITWQIKVLVQLFFSFSFFKLLLCIVVNSIFILSWKIFLQNYLVLGKLYFYLLNYFYYIIKRSLFSLFALSSPIPNINFMFMFKMYIIHNLIQTYYKYILVGKLKIKTKNKIYSVLMSLPPRICLNVLKV